MAGFTKSSVRGCENSAVVKKSYAIARIVSANPAIFNIKGSDYWL